MTHDLQYSQLADKHHILLSLMSLTTSCCKHKRAGKDI